MVVKFTKMHGLGNDFIVIDNVTQSIRIEIDQIKQLADRNFGIGFDQLLLVEPPTKPDCDFLYRIFNADGTEVEQCGNGSRCFARFVLEKKLTGKKEVKVETQGGDIILVTHDDGQVTVDMGQPRLTPSDIPFVAETQSINASYPIDAGSYGSLTISCISMGNPHGVLLVNDVEQADVIGMGSLLTKHERFPKEANIGFMQIIDKKTIKLRVFERGVGETLACGTGACAAVVAGKLRGVLDMESAIEVQLPGGTLSINWQASHSVFMTGGATSVFEGKVVL